MKRQIRRVLAALLCASLLCAPAVSGLADDYTVEEDGTKVYPDHFELPDGTIVPRVDHDNGETHADDGGSSESTTVQNSDGSVTVITNDQDIQVNDDGSVTVESGQIQIVDPETPAKELTPEEWEERMQRIRDRNGSYTPTAWKNPEDGRLVEVSVVYMGMGRSYVELNGACRFVNTVDLVWETEAPEDKVIAMIYAPKTGHAVLRSGKSKKATAITQCTHRYIVRVLAVGKTWTFVDYRGTRGYILTGSLEFHPNNVTEFRAARVSFKGRLKGNNPVHVRSANGTQLDEYPQGTPMTVFADDGEMCEIEIEGRHCFIFSKFVTYDDAAAAAQP